MPLRRATKLMLEPGSDPSATSRRFSSTVNRRRFPGCGTFDYFDPFRCHGHRSVLCLSHCVRFVKGLHHSVAVLGLGMGKHK
jgi:hypothetical protein